jgi:O-glycosyl hydrolase
VTALKRSSGRGKPDWIKTPGNHNHSLTERIFAMRMFISRLLCAAFILVLTACKPTTSAPSQSAAEIVQPSADAPTQHTAPTHAGQDQHPAHATSTPLPASAMTPGSTVTISIDGATRYQRFDGFGGTLTTFETDGIYKAHDPGQPERVTATDADRQAIAQMLYQQLGITRTRIILEGFEPQNDNTDPLTMNLAGFNWTQVDAEANWITLSRQNGLTTPWVSFAFDGSPGDDWRRVAGNACALNSSMVDEEVEWLMAAMLHLREMGQELPYLTINNEPDLCPPGYKIEIADYVSVVRKLGAQLRTQGFDTQIVVSDGFIPQNAVLYMQAVLNDADARQYVGALATHAYTDGYDDPGTLLGSISESQPSHAAIDVRQQIQGLAAQYNLPIWMTEVCFCVPRDYSDYDLVRGRLNHVQDELTIGGMSAFDVMNLFFIQRGGVQDELVEVFFAPDGRLERYEISLYGQMLAHYSLYALPGSTRIEATSSDPRVRVTAFQRPDGSVALVILNNNPTAVQIQISLGGMAVIPGVLSAITSSEGAIWQTQADAAVSNDTASLVLPPFSITSLAGQ